MNKLKWVQIFLLFSIIPLIFGCTRYSIRDYTTKEEYIREINNSIKDNKISVRLEKDSLISIKNGMIVNDTLFAANSYSIPLTTVKEISYKTYLGSTCLGTGIGLTTGFFGGLIIASTYPKNKEAHGDSFITISILVGTITGSVTGGIIGWTNIYKIDF